MNCQKGELAIFVRSDAGNDGNVVKCVRLATEDERNRFATLVPVWMVDRPVRWLNLLGHLELHPFTLDANLRPIRPEADPVTTDCDVGVEA